MAADGKWIDGLHGAMPALEAARQVLEVRLKAVTCRLPQAVRQADEDAEHVHQLRVSTRRAGAALRIFAALVPRKTYKRIRNKLRRLRRAAGAARDWDVFLQDNVERQARAPTTHRAGLDLLIGIAHGRRMAAQAELLDAADNPPLELEDAIGELLSSLRVPDDMSSDPTLRDLALPQLAELVRDLDAAASDDLADYEHLHQVRILGKRLRYAMEVFESCFAPKFRTEHYPAVEDMQDILGLANDSVVAAQTLEAIKGRIEKTQADDWKRYRRGIEALIKFHRQRLPEQRGHFERWWTQWRRSGGEKAFLRLLKGRHEPAGSAR